MAVDEEGLELRDLDVAQREAAQSLGAMVRDAALANQAEQMEIVIRDDDGAVMKVRFSFEISRKN